MQNIDLKAYKIIIYGLIICYSQINENLGYRFNIPLNIYIFEHRSDLGDNSINQRYIK